MFAAGVFEWFIAAPQLITNSDTLLRNPDVFTLEIYKIQAIIKLFFNPRDLQDLFL